MMQNVLFSKNNYVIISINIFKYRANYFSNSLYSIAHDFVNWSESLGEGGPSLGKI